MMRGMRFSRVRIQFSLSAQIVLICLIFLGSELFSQPLANGHSKFLGNIYGNSIGANFDSYWNQITPENAGKWGSVEVGRDVYNWGLDQVYNYALGRGIPFKLHTLVWGQQQPYWIFFLDSAQQAEEVEEWIKLVGERYPKMDFVDVVNEPLPNHAPAPYRNALGGSGSTRYDWVIKAFQLARQYCAPGVKLLLNDYNIINDDGNTTEYLYIINLLQVRGLIDGIGVQGHRGELENASVTTMRRNLDRLAATGLPIYISEFDVAPNNVLDDARQLAEYQRIFPVLWEHPGVKGITIWGYIQGEVWQTNTYLLRSDGTERPALQWLRTYLSTNDVIESTASTPEHQTLYQNYPNPFNPSTTIQYYLRGSSRVNVAIYNVLGIKVRTLVDSYQNVGEYSLVWDAMDDQKKPVSSGIYSYRLETGDRNLQRKMIFVK